MSTSAEADKQRYHHGNLREKLLERAVEVITQDGVEVLSLRSLARDLGVSHAAPSRHFHTKTELLAAVAEDIANDLALETARAIKGAKGGPLDRLEAMARAYIRWAVEKPARYGVLRNPEIMRHASEELREKILSLTLQQKDVLRAAQATGWKSEIPLDHLLFRLLANLAGTAIMLSAPHYHTIFPTRDDPGSVDFAVRSILE